MGDSTAFLLPRADSPTLALTQPTTAEKRHIDILSAQAFKGPLSVPAYIRREEFLAQQALTRDGGIMVWILIDTAEPTPADGEPRRILSSCETIRRRAYLKPKGGALKEITTYAVCTVFCDPEHRCRGFTRRLLKELSTTFDTWQQREAQTATFTVLYSDVGKMFYSTLGWDIFPSMHISLSPTEEIDTGGPKRALPPSSPLFASDLERLCRDDEQILRSTIEGRSTADTLVALVPDAHTLQWHHAREEFLATELQVKIPDVKGAMATFRNEKSSSTQRVWCFWARKFGTEEAENVLYILRIVVPEDMSAVSASKLGQVNIKDAETNPQTLAITAVLRAAQIEAARSGMREVHVWNPTESVITSAKLLDPAVRVIEREEESLTSMRMHGPQDARPYGKVEWLANERFGWC